MNLADQTKGALPEIDPALDRHSGRRLVRPKVLVAITQRGELDGIQAAGNLREEILGLCLAADGAEPAGMVGSHILYKKVPVGHA